MPSLARPRRSHRQTVLAGAALMAFSLVILMTQQAAPGFGVLRNAGSAAMVPFMDAGSSVHAGAGGIWDGLFNSRKLADENERLRGEIAEMRVQQALEKSRAAVAEESNRMAAAMPEFAPRTRPAAVMAPVMDGRKRRLWIAIGRDQGVEAGQTVLAPEGVIGTIREAHGSHSIVQLTTDSESRWGGEVAARGETGVLRGTGDPASVHLRLDKTTTNLEAGDVVQTSGLKGSIVPAGLPLGVVTDVGVDETGERHAVVKVPAEGAESMRTVFVLSSGQLPWEPVK